MSVLSVRVEFACGIGHPRSQLNYPFLPSRNRVLAIGGPFRFFLDYKAELLGHLHYGKRCCICLEVVEASLRPFTRLSNLLLCMKCFDE